MIRHFSAGITLVHASGLGLEGMGYGELTMADPGSRELSRATEEKRLRDFATEMFPSQHVEVIAEEGDAASVIHKVVQHQGADLVMLPTHGRGAVRRFLLGSVTMKLLHDLTTVVWTGVHSALAEHKPGIPYRSIVCALDKTEEAEEVLRSAAAFADSYGAQLSLVHVVETPPGAWDVDFEPYKKELMDAADHWLWEIKRTAGLDVRHNVIDAAMADGIRQSAVEKKADLVIVGRGHAQGAFGRMWSRLYPIVREAPCPVLSI
jgi:nucleotide-binding universal stress UspA family protein